jgi:white-opaque regulator 2
MAATTPEPMERDKIKQIFESLYGPAVDKFLETKWFTTRGLSHLFNNPLLVEKYKVLISRFGFTAATNYHENLVTQSLEAHVIWETFLLARQVSASINSTNDPNAAIETNEGVHEAAKRVEVFEALITNQRLEFSSEISEPSGQATPQTSSGPRNTTLDNQLNSRERDFWRYTSKFCTLKDDTKRASENPNEEIDQVLREMRLLLDSRENRDIIYSIAIARHVGHQLAEKAAEEGKGESNLAKPVSNNEESPETKVAVARNFIQAESAGKGTTQVTQRVCGMALMAWSKR